MLKTENLLSLSRMKNSLTYLASTLTGVLLGMMSTYSPLWESWYSLIPWSIGGLLVGFVGGGKGRTFWAGCAYGAFLAASFLATGFHGAASMILPFMIFSLVLSVIGAICGAFLAIIGNFVRKYFKRRQS